MFVFTDKCGAQVIAVEETEAEQKDVNKSPDLKESTEVVENSVKEDKDSKHTSVTEKQSITEINTEINTEIEGDATLMKNNDTKVQMEATVMKNDKPADDYDDNTFEEADIATNEECKLKSKSKSSISSKSKSEASVSIKSESKNSISNQSKSKSSSSKKSKSKSPKCRESKSKKSECQKQISKDVAVAVVEKDKEIVVSAGGKVEEILAGSEIEEKFLDMAAKCPPKQPDRVNMDTADEVSDIETEVESPRETFTRASVSFNLSASKDPSYLAASSDTSAIPQGLGLSLDHTQPKELLLKNIDMGEDDDDEEENVNGNRKEDNEKSIGTQDSCQVGVIVVNQESKLPHSTSDQKEIIVQKTQSEKLNSNKSEIQIHNCDDTPQPEIVYISCKTRSVISSVKPGRLGRPGRVDHNGRGDETGSGGTPETDRGLGTDDENFDSHPVNSRGDHCNENREYEVVVEAPCVMDEVQEHEASERSKMFPDFERGRISSDSDGVGSLINNYKCALQEYDERAGRSDDATSSYTDAVRKSANDNKRKSKRSKKRRSTSPSDTSDSESDSLTTKERDSHSGHIDQSRGKQRSAKNLRQEDVDGRDEDSYESKHKKAAVCRRIGRVPEIVIRGDSTEGVDAPGSGSQTTGQGVTGHSPDVAADTDLYVPENYTLKFHEYVPGSARSNGEEGSSGTDLVKNLNKASAGSDSLLSVPTSSPREENNSLPSSRSSFSGESLVSGESLEPGKSDNSEESLEAKNRSEAEEEEMDDESEWSKSEDEENLNSEPDVAAGNLAKKTDVSQGKQVKKSEEKPDVEGKSDSLDSESEYDDEESDKEKPETPGRPTAGRENLLSNVEQFDDSSDDYQSSENDNEENRDQTSKPNSVVKTDQNGLSRKYESNNNSVVKQNSVGTAIPTICTTQFD